MISRHTAAWEDLGDNVATDIMTRGFRLTFRSPPPLSLTPPPHAVTSLANVAKILPFVPDWLKRGVIREIFGPVLLFFSMMFTVPKPNDEVRPIIDLSLLNRLLVIPSFKMTSVDRIAPMLPEGCWGISVDIKDAYFHCPVAWEMQKFLAFVLGGRTFVFQVLPFGLSSAPWAFSRVMRPIQRKLTLMGILSFFFLDDWFLLAQSVEMTNRHGQILLDLLQSLGFQISWKKCALTPSQQLVYLGVLFDLKKMELSLPEDKQSKLRAMVGRTSLEKLISRRQLESLIGFLNFAASLVPLGRNLLYPLMSWLNKKTLTSTRDSWVPVDQDLRSALAPWLDEDLIRTAVPMKIPCPAAEIMTDASDLGWCGILLPHEVKGTWTQEEVAFSINWKELKAVHLTLVYFAEELQGQTVRVLSDNMSALACIRRQGTLACPRLLDLTSLILRHCQIWAITPVPVHLKGVLNVLADRGSRLGPIATEWTIDFTTFMMLCRDFGEPQVDLFATKENHRLEVYVSPCPDQAAVAMDAFSLEWNQWDSIYLFPPWNLLPQVVPHLEKFVGKGFMIAPYWPTRPWFLPLRRRCQTCLPLRQGHRLFQDTTAQGRVECSSLVNFNLHVWIL